MRAGRLDRRPDGGGKGATESPGPRSRGARSGGGSMGRVAHYVWKILKGPKQDYCVLARDKATPRRSMVGQWTRFAGLGVV